MIGGICFKLMEQFNLSPSCPLLLIFQHSFQHKFIRINTELPGIILFYQEGGYDVLPKFINKSVSYQN
jgi:hypothetical protein